MLEYIALLGVLKCDFHLQTSHPECTQSCLKCDFLECTWMAWDFVDPLVFLWIPLEIFISYFLWSNPSARCCLLKIPIPSRGGIGSKMVHQCQYYPVSVLSRTES